MKNSIIFLILIFAALTDSRVIGQTPALPPEFGPHQWTATVKGVGEDGNPVAAADVSFQYTVSTPPGSSEPTFGEVKGLTDTNGMFSASHTDSSYDLGVVIDKAGYYATQTGWQFYYDDKSWTVKGSWSDVQVENI
jgi:hypothetical protein